MYFILIVLYSDCTLIVDFVDSEDDENETESVSQCHPMLFQFNLKLPKILPPSCHLQYGFIVYDILFEWQELRDWDLNQWGHKIKSLPISIGSVVNLNEIPLAASPSESCKQEKFKFLCCNSGSIYVNMKTDKIGFVPGENLNFTILINNSAKFDVDKVEVALLQVNLLIYGYVKFMYYVVLTVLIFLCFVVFKFYI